MIGTVTAVLWERRARIWTSLVLAAAVTATAAWEYILIHGPRTPDYRPRLRAPGRGQGRGQGQGGPGDGGGFPGGGTAPGRNQQGNGAAPNLPTGEAGRLGGGPGGAGGMGGLLNGAQVGSEAKKLLEADADAYTWAPAAIGSQNAASYQLGTGEPVMAIGGFNGTDPSPTLIHYFIGGGGTGGGGMGGDSGTSSQITSWVEVNFKEVTAGSATFYDLTRPTT